MPEAAHAAGAADAAQALRRLRVAFAGTPPFAATALQRLLDAGAVAPLVLTQPDRAAGRGMKPQASAVKQLALAHGVPVTQPRSLRLDGRFAADAADAQHAEFLCSAAHDAPRSVLAWSALIDLLACTPQCSSSVARCRKSPP